MKTNRPISAIHEEIASSESIVGVCFCFLFSIAPHFRNLPLWISGLVLTALTWRLIQNTGRIPELSKWILAPLVLIGGASVFAEYWTVVGRDAGLALLTTMTAFKFLETRYLRDLLILFLLCYFLIATHFLFSQSIPTAIMMLITLVVITTALITINQRDDSVPMAHRLKTGSQLVALSIPLMLILFFLVPRIPGPLWTIGTEQRSGITGLSDNMSPGKISNMIRSNDVAFRVDFEGDIPPQNQLYWRGPVMAMFDGNLWYQSKRRVINQTVIPEIDNLIEYTVTLEANGQHWLLALDIPMQVDAQSILTSDYQLTSKKEINDLRRYTTKSQMDYQIGLQESAEYLELTSRFPADNNPRTIALGQELARIYQNPSDIVQHALAMFHDQNYVYTLKPPILRDNEVDRFLFDSKRGFCEHYSGSFALLMRTAGIPARIVTGYQGGEYNRIGNYMIVRQSDAHAWTEVWFKDSGWVRIDPTGAVSPTRIEQGLDNALLEEASEFSIKNRNPLLGNFLYEWDNLQYGWNNWVLAYDQRKQSNFLRDLELGIDDWGDMIFALVAMLLSVTGCYAFISWYRERPAKPAAHEICLTQLLKKLKKTGVEKHPAEDTRAFLRRVEARDPGQGRQIAKIIELYNLIKYGRREDDTPALNELRILVNSIQI